VLQNTKIESCGIPPFAKNAKDGAPRDLLTGEMRTAHPELCCGLTH
jgi:hypothetical protein